MRFVPVIMPNGSLNVFAVLDGRTPTLKWLQDQVAGCIETVCTCINGDFVMLVNEEGIFNELPVNITATDLSNGTSNILGNAVVLKRMGSELVPLTRTELAMIAAFCASNAINTRKVEPDDTDRD
jgi:hypothetical protein